MLIPVAPAKDESFYMNGDNARLVGVDSLGFLARSRSLENPQKINRKSSVFRKLVLDTFQQKRYRPISCDATPRPS